jgi:hypothetical protein
MKLGFVGMPRWALSLSGIGLVFAVTFSLSSVGAATWRATGVLAPAAVVTVGIAAALALRNWRLALVVPLVALSAAMTGILLSFPGYGLPAELVSLASPKSAAFPAAAALATGPMLLVIARIEALRWFGDPLPIAIGAAMTEVAFPLVALASLLALALIPTGYALAPLVALGGALFLAPALLGALEILFPQTRTAEQLLRRPPV